MPGKSKEREATPHGNGEESEEIEITLRFSGMPSERIKVAKGTRLKDFLKSREIGSKGLTLYLQGKKLEMDEEGELEDNPELTADCVLEILREKVVGGII